MPLAPVSLATQADFDAFEDDYIGRTPIQTLVSLYDTLSQGAEPATREADAILLQRLTLLHLRAAERAERLQAAFAVADRLNSAAPDSPHTIWLLAHVKRILLMSGSRDNTFRLTERTRDIAERLRADWERLLKVAPRYVGPGGEGAEEVARELASLQAALAAEPSSGSAEGSKAREMSAIEVTAREQLWAFERGTEGDRTLACRDWAEAKRGEKDAEVIGLESGVVRFLDLTCAIHEDRAEDALDLLANQLSQQLVGDPCRYVRQLQFRRSLTELPQARSLAAALESQGRPVCEGLAP